MHTETIQCLTGLAIGDRAWFWLCPDISIDGDRLVLTAFKSDPGMDALEAAVDGIDIPIGAQYYMGILQVQGDGTCAFGGLQLNAAALFALAEWVRHHADAQPELALLAVIPP